MSKIIENNRSIGSKEIWFKRKKYGWGWTPFTWQGWLVTLVYIALILAFIFTIDENSPTREVFFMLVLPLVILTSTFVRIAYKKSEKPKWQWGEDNSDDSK